MSATVDTTVFEHPWTPLLTEAAEHHPDLRTREQIAEWLVDQIDWDELPRQSRIALVSQFVRVHGPLSLRRRATFDVGVDEAPNGSSESVMRLAAAGSIWDRQWPEAGYRETRELTLEDIDTLKMAYKIRAARSLIQVKWFDQVGALMKKHKAQRAGDLERNGVALPTSILKVEAGE